MRLLHIIFATWIVLTLADCCNAKAWRGIVPLKSTRADVERLLGRPTGSLPTYYLSDSTVDFKYSSCKCGEKCENDDWKVPPDTVIVIRVGLRGVVKIADLHIDLSKFKKEAGGDPDVPGNFFYENEEEGLAIDTGGGYVRALIYGPRAKDDYLRCRHNSSQPQKHTPKCSSKPRLETKTGDWKPRLGSGLRFAILPPLRFVSSECKHSLKRSQSLGIQLKTGVRPAICDSHSQLQLCGRQCGVISRLDL